MANRGIPLKIQKEIYAKSGNQCAFTNCSCQLFIQDVTTSEICHIEGLKPNSARYNPTLTDDQANCFQNLILLCPTHHALVDGNEGIYTVMCLRQMKHNHEQEISELLKNGQSKIFFDELQKIFQDCRFDMIFLEQSFDTPFPDWYFEKVEEGYCRIRDLLNNQCSLNIHATTRAELYSFTQLAEYIMTGVAMNTKSNGAGMAIPCYNPNDLDATNVNVKSLQNTYLKYRFMN